MDKAKGKLNRLADEVSPYLLQHAANPVDWYPWCDEAFARARQENKPVLLSIGYSACHWCHVMAHESFESEDIAALLNEGFICIKVDREERPDIDHVYMQAVQALTGRGGWPLNVFLTPDGRPFFGGSYFPAQAKYGMPGFDYVLETVKKAFEETRGDIEQHAEELQKALSSIKVDQPSEIPDIAVLDMAFDKMAQDFDGTHGGFGSAPKFPEPMSLEFLMRTYSRKKEERALRMVELTLKKMAEGGIYDQVGGGFHRYSTDNMWLVPHFEKMLYDNALLARTCLYLYLVNGKEIYKEILCGTLDYLLSEMRSEEGGFFSTQDADSEGEEGKYYTWTGDEFRQAVGKENATAAGAYYNVSEKGNFEGRNILYIKNSSEALQADVLSAVKRSLADKRSGRVKPGRDEKVIASWNGMLISSLSEAGAALGRADYLEAAEKCAEFIAGKMLTAGKLAHTIKAGRPGGADFLEDYACVAQGLMDLYSATFNSAWLDLAISLADKMIVLFTGGEDGLLSDTRADGEKLFMDSRNTVDSAVPCGNSSAARALLYLYKLTGKEDYLKAVEPALIAMQVQMSTYPRGFANWLCAMDLYLAASLEISVICGSDNKEADAIRKTIHKVYLPNKILAAACPGAGQTGLNLEMLDGKLPAGEKTSVYICIENTCGTPVTDADELDGQLRKISQAV